MNTDASLSSAASVSSVSPVSPVAPARTHLPVLTSAERRVFQSCKRKHYLRYRLLKRPLHAPESAWLTRAVHRAIRAWWSAARTGDDRLAFARLELNRTDDDLGAPPIDPFDLAKAEAIVAGYHARWSRVAVEVLAVGAEFTAPIVNPDTGKDSRTYALGGKIDAIARFEDGGVHVVSHRTTSENIEPGAEYWQRLRLDPQVFDAYVGARSLGYEVAGAYHDVIAKPRLVPLLATPIDKRQYTKKDNRLYAGQREADETPAEYAERVATQVLADLERFYARVAVKRVAEEEREAALDTWGTARDVREADLALRHPRNGDACKGWTGMCEYFGVCTGEVGVGDAGAFRAA